MEINIARETDMFQQTLKLASEVKDLESLQKAFQELLKLMSVLFSEKSRCLSELSLYTYENRKGLMSMMSKMSLKNLHYEERKQMLEWSADPHIVRRRVELKLIDEKIRMLSSIEQLLAKLLQVYALEYKLSL